MFELIELCNGIKGDLQGIIKTLAKITKTRTQLFSDEWNRKDAVLKLLGISPRTFNRMIYSGQLPYSKINGIIYIKTTDVENLLNENYRNSK